jgi:DNA polymerase elongation subunit (family B)
MYTIQKFKCAVFDIETGPRPTAEIIDLAPDFTAPANYKDDAKIAAAIEEQKTQWLGRAALSAVTGRVLAVGWWQEGETTIIGEDDESETLRKVWTLIETAARENRTVVGFNSNRFDIPFLTRRSWALGVDVPSGLYGARGYVNQLVFMDLMDEWACGDRQATIRLDTLAKFLGVGAKNGNGAEFAGLWETDRPKALEYLHNDILITARVAARLIGFPDPAAPPPVEQREMDLGY